MEKKKTYLVCAPSASKTIAVAVTSLRAEILAVVVRNFRRRLQMVSDADGAHIGNVFT
jgi:hypothetical protein